MSFGEVDADEVRADGEGSPAPAAGTLGYHSNDASIQSKENSNVPIPQKVKGAAAANSKQFVALNTYQQAFLNDFVIHTGQKPKAVAVSRSGMGLRQPGSRNMRNYSSLNNKGQKSMLSKTELTNVSSKRDFSDTRGFATPQYATAKYNINHGRSNTSHGFKPRKFNVEDELPRLRKKYEGGIWGYGQRLAND